MTSLRRRLVTAFLAIVAITILGTTWYVSVEGWTWLDGLYMTIITLTTVGYGEIQPLSPTSRLFTSILILLGVGTVAYSLSQIGEYVLAEGVAERIRSRALRRVVGNMDNHIIICGAGRVGRTAAQTLAEMERPFLILEADEDVVRELRADGFTAMAGDATRDEILEEAGVGRAAGLLVCTGNDSDNLFIVLSARTLMPDLFIVARSVDAQNDAKMRRAGANKVISPYQIGGRHMANVVVRPKVAEFMDIVTLNSGLELWLEELVIDAGSPLADKTVGEADVRRRTGASLVGLIRGEDTVMITPDAETCIEAGDLLIVLGTREQLSELERLSTLGGEGNREGEHD